MWRNRWAKLSWVQLTLLCILASVRCASIFVSSLGFRAALQPLYHHAVFTNPIEASALCAGEPAPALKQLTIAQRLVIGSLWNYLNCAERAAQVLPPPNTTGERATLLLYQWGLTAWAREDTAGAAAFWRQGQAIDQSLLARARQVKDLAEAQRWYEAAMMAAGSPQMQAETLTAYTEDLRGRIPAETFQARLAYLETYWGADTAWGYRLRGQRALLAGDYGTAAQQFERAITLGFADAETWYWLGETAKNANYFTTAENAFRAALVAPIQVPGRRPWHLDRLAALLITQQRPAEALVFQEEAVCLNDYYFYADNLAVLYTQLGQTMQAEAMCAQAATSPSAPQKLRCQQP